MSAFAVVIGVAAALVAKVLLALIGFITNVAYFGRVSGRLSAPDPSHWGLIAVLIPVAGAIAVGLIARYGTDKIRGHGIPEAIQSILNRDSIIQARVAFYKPIASAITIGTGGPFGAEGPIIMTGGALGSLFAQFMHLSSIERRTLLVCGASAGMAATFGAPIASVMIAVELLLFEWRPRSFIPVVVAAFVGYMMRTSLIGNAPPFLMGHPQAIDVSGYGWAVAVGIGGGIVSALMTKLVYVLEDAYERLPIHWMWWPAIGAIVVGIGGWFAPGALGVGYGAINGMLNAHLAIGLVIGIIAVKIIIWSTALSSGTSGGVLAPLLMIGAAMGTLFSLVIPGHHAGAWAAVGMAALMGGTMRAPFMGTLFAIETTHAWGLLPPVFIACIAATAFTVVFVPRSILTKKLARRGTHVSREYSVHPLELIAVGDVMLARDALPAFLMTETIGVVRQRLMELNVPRALLEYPLLDDRGAVAGFAAYADIAHGAPDASLETVARTARAISIHDRVRSAATSMAETEDRSLAVLDDAGNYAGILTLDELMRAWKVGTKSENQRKRVRSFRFQRATSSEG